MRIILTIKAILFVQNLSAAPEVAKKSHPKALREIEQLAPNQRAKYRDTIEILKAMELEAKGNLTGAAKTWLKAVKLSRGEAKEFAKERYRQLHAEISPKTELPREARTNGPDIRNSWTLAELRKISKLANSPLQFQQKLIKKTHKCPKQNDHFRDIEAWAKKKPVAIRLYVAAKKSDCLGEADEAASKFLKAARAFDSKGWGPLTVFSMQSYIRVLRHNSRRDKAASEYPQLLALWKKYPAKIAEGRLDEINDTLWAARYAALMGNYSSARKYVGEAKGLISTVLKKFTHLSKKQRTQLAELTIEAQHVLAFRIAFEQKLYKRALAESSLDKLPSKLRKYTTKIWHHRLLWYRGLYQFHRQEYRHAANEWRRLLGESDDDRTQERLLYWLARVSTPEKAAKYVKKLNAKYPLGFYSTVAVPKTKALPKKPTIHFKPNSGSAATSHPIFTKMQYLFTLELPHLATFEADRIRGRLMAGNARISGDSQLLLAQVLYGRKRYADAIRLINNFAGDHLQPNWRSEALPLFFPKGHAKVFQDAAKRQSVPVDLLFAITRKESLFDHLAVSHAGARGLMQLMPSTAEELFAEGIRADDLLIPEKNILGGAKNIRVLLDRFGFQPWLIFAAYNAGPFAVERWLSTRFELSRPILSIETIPFGETREYVKSVWRNLAVYQYIPQAEEINVALFGTQR